MSLIGKFFLKTLDIVETIYEADGSGDASVAIVSNLYMFFVPQDISKFKEIKNPISSSVLKLNSTINVRHISEKIMKKYHRIL